MTKTVLITGVAGLLGSRLADWIVKNKPDVHIVGIDDLSGGYISNVNKFVQFNNLDLSTDTVAIDALFNTHQFDVVYHFAAYAAEALSPFIRQYNYTNNLLATAGIVNNCIKYNVKRLVFTSSMGVYGFGAGEPPFHEGMARSPIDPYGIAKAACEQDIEVAGTQHGLDWCIIRPHNVYGANQNIWDSYRNV
jgi:UDP-glucose 4-epimerase